jgi:[pyruvate, water dikinase]-phosphate phosphotransferase / [pyruvate, water dikinase] kinase
MQPEKKKIAVHLISDSTGLTVESVAKSSMAQFLTLDPTFYNHHFVRTPAKLGMVLRSVQENPGPVFSTLAQPKQAEILQTKCKDLKVPLIPVLDVPVKMISEYTGITECNWGQDHAIFGIQHFNTPEYEKRMEAIHFAIDHDDGQNFETLFTGDIIILGVSRTSKTPTSIFLANKGYRTGNIPLIPGTQIKEELLKFIVDPTKKKPVVVGLTINADRLADIRINRIRDLDPERATKTENSYTNIEVIKEEILEFRRFFGAFNVPVIDVTRRSIEEISSRIIDLLAD